MIVLGIETSCDECSVAVVEDGRKIISNIIATQIGEHRIFNGVVPEIASRLHTEWIVPVTRQALKAADIPIGGIGGIAVTTRPGLVGSLLVGLNFAKGLAASLDIPFTGVDHIRAHLYAPHLECDIDYPYLGVLVSGGHTIICVVEGFNDLKVLGTTIDDAIGEAFDKVAKHYGFGYPGGIFVEKLALKGDPKAFSFPEPSLHKGEHRYDVSYSGLKTAVINQLDQFANPGYEKSPENIAASFQKTAVSILMKRVRFAAADRGIKRIVAGGGVAANLLVRKELAAIPGIEVIFPSMELCTDNGAMIAGIGYHYLRQYGSSPYNLNASARVEGFRKTCP